MLTSKASFEIVNLVMSQAMTLEERLACVLSSNGGKNTLSDEVKVDDIHFFNGMCGYNYWEGDNLIAQLHMGTLVSGTYVIFKKTNIDGEVKECYDYYDQKGNFFYQSETLDGQCTTYSSISMDPSSPFINHIYNILHTEYEGTTFNYGNTGRIKFLEDILNNFFKDDNYTLSANAGLKDKALAQIGKEIIGIENDAVLKWTERQTIFKQLKEVRTKILSTKRRTHNFQYMLYDVAIMSTDIKLKFKTFKQNPLNNFIGSFYKHTLGNLFWFINTVKSNLGYSVAMAIYGPFTFYFVTQPMNPHAMWAVGKVRNSYIQVTKAFEPKMPEESLVADYDEETVNSSIDSVSTKQAAPKKLVYAGKKISWDDRMSNFKGMQVSFEEAMVFAERMGRIEQFETQFNFPLTTEAAWMEMEQYLEQIDGIIQYNKNLDAKYITFLNNEKERTIELEFYLWQKMGQFFLDHPYIVVDEEKEQTERNYYLGRQFVFFQKMSEKLSDLGIANSPETHKDIEKLAKKFSKMKVEGNSVLDTLRKNSKLFKQKNYLSSEEQRSYMKRHWEVLFMQQNKKQEASSFSLQAYTTSVRNAIWLLQTIYSSKRGELWKLTANYNLDNTAMKKQEANPMTNEYLENMFNNMAMEFVSIKKEMVENLPGDSEAQLRKNVINNIKSYIMERDKLFDTSVYASNGSGSNSI